MSDPGVASVESDGFVVESNRVSQETLEDTFREEKTPEEQQEERSKAASELGKAGGKAAAKARKAAEKEAKKTAEDAEEKPKEEPSQEGKEASQSEKAETKPRQVEESDEGSPEAPEEPREATSEEESAKGTEESEEKPLGKPRDDPRARMLEATRKEAQAKRELAAERERYRALEERLARIEKGAAPAEEEPQGPPAEPQPEDFEDWSTYMTAHTGWIKSEAKREILAEIQQHQQAASVDNQYREVIQKYAEAVRETADQWSDDVKNLRAEFQLEEGERPSAENWIANELVFSPESASALALHLSTHPDEFQRIAALSTPRDVSREMAKLEARLEAATSGTSSRREKEVSKAPPPIQPVKGGAYVGEDDLTKDMPFHVYFEKANKKLGKRPTR